MAVDDNYTKILLHFNGEDESTAIVDQNSANTWEPRCLDGPLCQLDTAVKKFGASSLLCNGFGYCHLINGLVSDQSPGSGDYTIDFFFRLSQSIEENTNVGFYISGLNDDKVVLGLIPVNYGESYYFRLELAINDGLDVYVLTFGETDPFEIANIFYHIEICRSGNDYKMFRDGQLLDTKTVVAHTLNLAGGQFRVYNTAMVDSWIDEFRYSKGIARHTANFTPPAKEYEPVTQHVDAVALGAIAGLSGTPDPSWTRIKPPALESITELSGTPRWNQVYKVSPSAFDATSGLSGIPAYLFSLEVLPLSVTAGLSSGDISIFANSSDFIITYLCRVYPLFGGEFLTLPMSSFQGRFKSGDPSYLSVVVPGLDYAQEIADLLVSFNRQNYLTLKGGGEVSAGDSVYVAPALPSSGIAYPELAVYMVTTFASGNQITELLMAVNLENIDTYEGATNQSMTLEGHRTHTYTPKIVALTGESYRNTADGKLRYRCAPDMYLRPGDTVTINGETFTADDISIYKSVDSETFEFAQGIPGGTRLNPVLLRGG